MNTFLLTPIHHVSIIAHGFVRNTHTTPSELVRYTAYKSTKHVFHPNACMRAFAKDAATLYAIWCKETVAFPPRTPTYGGMHAYSIHAHTNVHALTRIDAYTHKHACTHSYVQTCAHRYVQTFTCAEHTVGSPAVRSEGVVPLTHNVARPLRDNMAAMLLLHVANPSTPAQKRTMIVIQRVVCIDVQGCAGPAAHTD